mgnify:CR=1 FL=1
MQQQWQRAVEFRSKQAEVLADLLTLSRDFRFALRAVELLLEITPKNPSLAATQDDFLSEINIRRTSLWNAAVAAYMRGFQKGI